MILMTLKKMKFASALKNENKKEERLLKKQAFFKKEKRKQEQFKESEQAYWKRLGELNKQIKANKRVKKEAKKNV